MGRNLIGKQPRAIPIPARYVYRAFLALFILAAAFAVVASARAARVIFIQSKTDTWIEAQGEITERTLVATSWMPRSNRNYRQFGPFRWIHFAYTYNYAGATYSTRQVTLAGTPFSTWYIRTHPLATADVGTRVAVYIDPAVPGNAVLVRGLPPGVTTQLVGWSWLFAWSLTIVLAAILWFLSKVVRAENEDKAAPARATSERAGVNEPRP